MAPSGDLNPIDGQQQPIPIHPDNALHLQQPHQRHSSQSYVPPSQRSYKAASQKNGANQPATHPYKLPPLWSAGSTPPPSTLPDAQASSHGALAMKGVSQSHSAGTAPMTAQRKTMQSEISYLPTPSLQTKPQSMHASSHHVVGLPAYESSSSRASSPVASLATPGVSPPPTSLPSYSNHPTTQVQNAISDITTITSTTASSSSSSANGDDVEKTSPALEGVKQYLHSQFHDHPAHMVKCKAASVKAMAGESGQPPTRTDIKKGLHTLSEQRRRWSINEGYEQLRAIVPHCDNGRSSGPMPKAAVLSRAANYIGDLTMYITQLREALKEKDDRIARMIEASTAGADPPTSIQLHLPTRKVTDTSASATASSAWSGTIRHLQSSGLVPRASATLVAPLNQPAQSSATASSYPRNPLHSKAGRVQRAQPITINETESNPAKRARSSTFPAGMDDPDGREGFLPPPASHLPSADMLGPSYELYSSPSASGYSHAQLPPLKRKRSPLAAELNLGQEDVGNVEAIEPKFANGLCA